MDENYYEIIEKCTYICSNSIEDLILKAKEQEEKIKKEHTNITNDEVKHIITKYFTLKFESGLRSMFERVFGKPAQYKRYNKMWDTNHFRGWKRTKSEWITLQIHQKTLKKEIK